MQAVGRADKMQGVTSEELVVTLTERDQALHHRVEVIVRQVVE